MVHGQPFSYHTFVCLKYLPIYRLSYSPWCHLDFQPRVLCFYLLETSDQTRTCACTASTASRARMPPTENACDSMEGSVPTVEMTTVELVEAYIARGVLVSLLCQSKNSEVLNTFHPSSGRGLTMPLEKVWRNTRSVNSSGWLYSESLCVQGCYRHATRKERE